MLIAVYTNSFKRDLKRVKKRGKNLNKLKDIIAKIVNEEPLPTKNKEHKLIGNYKDRWECHIESDWLLVYKVTSKEAIFVGTGTHSDLF
ncbi:MAG: mRNA interferase YafQ [Candidatus Anoxychlamydiales bacterium]|nr:mRNA interferase YafQ [Candidatus Anoxychlamydiales bacterium]NGX52764.1 mRNA interferase YafQ [Candidatus Anoxychlamydiales bacterium]